MSNSMISEDIKQSINLLDYFKVFLFIICCGFPNGQLIPAKSYLLILLGIITLSRDPGLFKRSSANNCIIIVIAMIMVIIMHVYMFTFVEIVLLKLCILVIAGFLTFLSMGARFIYVFFKIMYWLCAISLPCFFLTRVLSITPNVDFLNSDGYQGFFLWNVRHNEIIRGRNCGPFWEPGAFAGYIIFTFCLFFHNLNELWRFHKKECIVMAIALITTFSTQGYITAFILMVFNYIKRAKRELFSVIFGAFLVILPASYFAYISLPFLHEKVSEQLSLASSWEDQESLLSANRFSTTMVDLYNIERQPLWGNSSNQELLYGEFSTIMYSVYESGSYGSGSGMTSYAASFGTILLLVWIVLSYKSLYKYYETRTSALCVLFILCFLGQGEQYMAYILYQSVPFLQFVNYHYDD